MTIGVTPPLCDHCGRLMQFIAAHPNGMTPGQWDETWRCPDGRCAGLVCTAILGQTPICG
jgi:hypothetical protein